MTFENGKSLGESMRDLLKESERLMGDYFKGEDVDIIEVFNNLDETSAPLIVKTIKLYKKTAELAVLQAQAMDIMIDKLVCLENSNLELKNQNDKIQRSLNEIRVRIEK